MALRRNSLALNIFFFALTEATRFACPPPSYAPEPTRPTPDDIEPCPRHTLKFGGCVDALKMVNATMAALPVKPCCSLISGLLDLEAAVCLCTAIKATILGMNINLPINLSVLFNVCSRKTPRGFQCP